MRGRTRRIAQRGFSYIEILVGVMILAIVAGAVVQGFAASSAQVGKSRIDSVSNEIAQGRLEELRRMPYNDIGTVGGNPPGVIPVSETRRVGSTDYLVETAVTYVDDPALGRPRSYVNYKQITVTVTPQVPGTPRPVSQSTFAAPPNFGAINGLATAVITVIDASTDQPIPGVAIQLGGSTSPTRTGTTDAQGKIVFAGLDPSDPVPTSTRHFYVATVTSPGFITHPDSIPTRQSLAAAQTWQATIKVFRPVTIRVNLRDAASGDLITERGDVRITSPPPTAVSEGFTTFTGVVNTTTIGGRQIQPSSTATRVDVTVDCFEPATQSSPVPVGYPINTTQVFDFNLQRVGQTGYLDVWVLDAGTNAPITSAQVQVSGGEARLSPRLRSVDANGYARYCIQRSGTVRYVVSAGAPGYGAGSLLAEVETGQTTPVQLRLVRAATGDIRLSAGREGALVRLQAQVGTYDASQPTNTFGYADFTGLAAGDYTAYIATGFSGEQPIWSTGKTVRANGGQMSTYTVP